MTDTHWAAISTLSIFVTSWALVAVAVNAYIAHGSVAAIVGFVCSLAILPATWRFCYQEARNAKGK